VPAATPLPDVSVVLPCDNERAHVGTVLSTSVGRKGIPSSSSSRGDNDDLPTRGAPPTR
jgi:hypothetical protein